MLAEMMEAINLMRRSAPEVEVSSISIDQKSRERLVFEMMKQDRQNSDPKPEYASRFGGVVSLLGVEIKGETK